MAEVNLLDTFVKTFVGTNFRDLTVGRRIGFYEVKGDLGRGNFSSVKLAIHSITDGRTYKSLTSLITVLNQKWWQ